MDRPVYDHKGQGISVVVLSGQGDIHRGILIGLNRLIIGYRRVIEGDYRNHEQSAVISPAGGIGQVHGEAVFSSLAAVVGIAEQIIIDILLGKGPVQVDTEKPQSQGTVQGHRGQDEGQFIGSIVHVGSLEVQGGDHYVHGSFVYGQSGINRHLGLIVNRINQKGNVSGVAAAVSVINGIGKAVLAVIVGIRGIGDGTVKIDHCCSVGGIAHRAHYQKIAVDVDIVGQHGDRHRGIFIGRS